jgi:hypothetical protein
MCGVRGGWLLSCDGGPGIFGGADSQCSFPTNNRWMPVVAASTMASQLGDGVVNVIRTNVETWDGHAYTYGEEKYYVIVGYSESLLNSSDIKIKLLDVDGNTSTRRVKLDEIRQRYSSGSVNKSRDATIIAETDDSVEVIQQMVGVDAIVDHYN